MVTHLMITSYCMHFALSACVCWFCVCSHYWQWNPVDSHLSLSNILSHFIKSSSITTRRKDTLPKTHVIGILIPFFFIHTVEEQCLVFRLIHSSLVDSNMRHFRSRWPVPRFEPEQHWFQSQKAWVSNFRFGLRLGCCKHGRNWKAGNGKWKKTSGKKRRNGADLFEGLNVRDITVRK